MTAPLREPFFLCGRKSVLQRAVIMSLALAGLATLAGWTVASAFHSVRMSRSFSGLPVLAWGIAATAFIHAPLNHWNGRPKYWTLIALPANLTLFVAWSVWTAAAQSSLQFSEGAAAAWGFLGIQFGSIFLLGPTTRIEWLAATLSLVAVIVPAIVINLPASLAKLNLAGLGYEELRLVIFAAVWISLFAAFAIPWGLPFWWPPERESPTEPAQ